MAHGQRGGPSSTEYSEAFFRATDRARKAWLADHPEPPAQVVDFGEKYKGPVQVADALGIKWYKESDEPLQGSPPPPIAFDSMYPHTCPTCGAPAYVGALKIECSQECGA